MFSTLREMASRRAMDGNRVRSAIYAFVLLAGLLLASTGFGSGIEQQLRNVRDDWRRHPASGAVYIVDIDAKSLARIAAWPWPRRAYARLLDRLDKAHPDAVAFDIDLSAPSNARDDLAFANALARFGSTVILPTFRQTSSADSKRMIENLPLKPFAEHAFVASVNVHPDQDGVIRDYSYGERTGGIVRPSIGALLSGANGNIGRQFSVDQSIDPDTIPRSSFVDILDGKVPDAQFRGRKILVGATAVELGDRYPTTRYGIQPGVVVQAMAVETLLEGGSLNSIGPWPIFIFASLAGLIIATRTARQTRQIAMLLAMSSVLAVPAIMEQMRWGSAAVVPSLILLAMLGLGLTMLDVLHTIRRARSTDSETGLHTVRAFARTIGPSEKLYVAAHISNFSQIGTLISVEQRGAFLRKIIDRLSLGPRTSELARYDAATFVWTVEQRMDDVVDHLSALHALFRQPIESDGRKLNPTITFGLSNNAGDAHRALAEAVQASTRAAEEGLTWCLHSEALNAESDRAQAILGEIEQAIADGEIWIAYQPKLDLSLDRISGAEALVRWRHPQRGPISPDQFIPVLEQARRIDQLTLFIADLVFRDMQRWQASGQTLKIAINVSAVLLSNAAFVKALTERLVAQPELAANLTIEVTESAAMSDEDSAIETLNALVELGVTISIDDYGTGQSTLSYLKRFPASEIKIDQSFIKNLATSRSDQLLVRSTVELAHSLGFDVVAEGIEDQETLDILRNIGCDRGQGWQIGKPMPASELERICEASKSMAA